VVHKTLGNFRIGFYKFSRIYRVVFNNIYEVGWHLAVNFYQFISILYAVVKVLKQDVFKRDLVAGLAKTLR
jgi:formate hydrogenlyase subunit 3/multisubunit Na+/H+ antiporter MnhD subunit